jgi:hypothetical protein
MSAIKIVAILLTEFTGPRGPSQIHCCVFDIHLQLPVMGFLIDGDFPGADMCINRHKSNSIIQS